MLVAEAVSNWEEGVSKLQGSHFGALDLDFKAL